MKKLLSLSFLIFFSINGFSSIKPTASNFLVGNWAGDLDEAFSGFCNVTENGSAQLNFSQNGDVISLSNSSYNFDCDGTQDAIEFEDGEIFSIKGDKVYDTLTGEEVGTFKDSKIDVQFQYTEEDMLIELAFTFEKVSDSEIYFENSMSIESVPFVSFKGTLKAQ
ncbi:MAG: hypothetical protein H6621_05085 [Halobacteriovoraceae bacterium]|nr:hypothetical protein [Halobacteriovoraceae bacterium]